MCYNFLLFEDKNTVMNIFELFAAPEMSPYFFSLAILIAILLIEGLALLASGIGPIHMLDGLFDSLHLHEGLVSHAFGFFELGKIPFIITLSLFLTLFTFFGFGVQFLFYAITGSLLEVTYLSFGIAIVSFVAVKLITPFFHALKNNNPIVLSQNLIGSRGIVVIGKATRDNPAEIKVVDVNKFTHYVRGCPESDEVFVQGDEVVLYRMIGKDLFLVVKAEPINF